MPRTFTVRFFNDEIANGRVDCGRAGGDYLFVKMYCKYVTRCLYVFSIGYLLDYMLRFRTGILDVCLGFYFFLFLMTQRPTGQFDGDETNVRSLLWFYLTLP